MAKKITDGDGRPATIRMFPDYAHTVLWLDQPIRYSQTGLSDGLIAELQAWEESYYDSLDDDIEWVSDDAARAFTEEGVRLMHRVSAEVGPQFTIEFASYEPNTETRHVRAAFRAENPAAEEAFTHLVDVIDAEERETAELRRASSGEWTAYAPRSGTVFDPFPDGQSSRDRN